METDKEIIVLYHNKCLDGMGGAYAAWKKFGDTAAYIPVRRAEPFPEGFEGKEVYLIDFSYSKEVLLEVERTTKRFIAMDHHLSAKENIEAVREHVFDLSRSGCVIAWDYFHPGKSAPKLLQHIQEVDLWKYTLPHQTELRAYLNTISELEFSSWEKLAADFENPEAIKKYIQKGGAYLEYLQLLKETLAEEADLVEFEGHTVLAANAPGFFISDLGNELSKRHAPFGIVWYEKEGMRRFGLRGDGSIDVSSLAARYGGGGHHDAAGFRTSLDAPLPFKRVSPEQS
ncbi:hypothetical protein KW797_00870 [Candidatus Parcubacteria bacterium]|nr:hypothetical protein [Candidatus Parcubacteria bacterium]